MPILNEPPGTESSDNSGIEDIHWPDLFNTLWPGAHAIRTASQAKAFEASVRDRCHNLHKGDIARALQSLSERQRCRDETAWKGVPGPSQVVSQITRSRYESHHTPDEVQSARQDRINGYKVKLRQAADHRARWDLMCDAGDWQTGGLVDDCIELHRWVCQQWRDFPVDVTSCRRAFEGGAAVLPAGMPF